MQFPCAIGCSGITHLKREGDGATPAGHHRILQVLVRPDRIHGLRTLAPMSFVRPQDGWSDDPSSGRYNRRIGLPARESHERMWRDDALYDLVGILDWNIRSRVSRRGSAIFLHAAREGFGPTEGCVALRPADLRRLLASIGPGAEIRVGVGSRKRNRIHRPKIRG